MTQDDAKLCRGFVEAVASDTLSDWAPENGLPEWDWNDVRAGDREKEVCASLYRYHGTVAQALYGRIQGGK